MWTKNWSALSGLQDRIWLSFLLSEIFRVQKLLKLLSHLYKVMTKLLLSDTTCQSVTLEPDWSKLVSIHVMWHKSAPRIQVDFHLQPWPKGFRKFVNLRGKKKHNNITEKQQGKRKKHELKCHNGGMQLVQLNCRCQNITANITTKDLSHYISTNTKKKKHKPQNEC